MWFSRRSVPQAKKAPRQDLEGHLLEIKEMLRSLVQPPHTVKTIPYKGSIDTLGLPECCPWCNALKEHDTTYYVGFLASNGQTTIRAYTCSLRVEVDPKTRKVRTWGSDCCKNTNKKELP